MTINPLSWGAHGQHDHVPARLDCSAQCPRREAARDVTRVVGRPALRVLGPGEAERQTLLEELVLRQRAGGLSAKTIRERLAVVSRLSDPVHLTRSMSTGSWPTRRGRNQRGRPTTARSAPGACGWSAPDGARMTPR